MKKLFYFSAIIIALFFGACSESFDDSMIWDKLENHESRISQLEELCKQMNTNISSLQTIVNALQQKDYISTVAPINKDGKEVGYTITFSSGKSITIYHGNDGKDGADGSDGKDGEDGDNGYTPQIGVKKDVDGIYYWTIDGEWLTDSDGNKVHAQGKDGLNGGKDGEDGKDGINGTDGKDGKDGQDGVTPQLKIEDDYWYVSYDNGATWTKLGKAKGEDGKDGADGKDGQDGKDGVNGEDGKDGSSGDNVFQSVTQDANNVYFVLSDGTTITIPKAASAENIELTYIPRYSDGKATVFYTEKADSYVELDFQVSPKNMASSITNSWRNSLKLLATSTITRAVSYIEMPISECSCDTNNGTITIKASGKNLPSTFFENTTQINAALFCSYNGIESVSEFIPFTATFNPYTDLSSAGTANCYIISNSGNYKFKATVIGNGDKGIISNANFHTTSASISPTSASLLWEDNTIVKNIKLENGYIHFTASSNEGNALIAAKNSSGEIIWSWHIWATDKPKEYKNYDGYYTLDRNIGAISANYLDGQYTYGLYYQWGRKDPLRDPSTVVNTTSTTGNISYTIQHPTQLIGGSFYNWQYSNKSEYLWGYKSNIKTIYDPCPVGYKIALPTSSKDAYTYNSQKPGGRWDGQLWYPFAGRLDWETGKYCTHDAFVSNVVILGNCGYYYVNTYSNSTKNDTYDQYYSAYKVLIDNLQFKGFAESVRCIRE